MLGDLSTVDPVVDPGKAVGEVGVLLLDESIRVVEKPSLFLVSRHHDIFVHELVQHRAPPFGFVPVYPDPRW